MKLSPHELAFVAQWAGFSGDDLITAVAFEKYLPDAQIAVQHPWKPRYP